MYTSLNERQKVRLTMRIDAQKAASRTKVRRKSMSFSWLVVLDRQRLDERHESLSINRLIFGLADIL